MDENEILDEETIDTDIESEDENQDSDDTIESQDDEEEQPKKKSLVQTLRDEIKELKKAKKNEKSSKIDQSLEMRLFFIENPDYKENKE